MKRILQGIFIATALAGCSQLNNDLNTLEGKIEKIFDLPDQLTESSGIIIIDSLVWSFNDSGNEPLLIGVSLLDGHIVKKVFLQNADNNDWEDITQDTLNIYIGDIGNISGNRKNLAIYILSKDSIDVESYQTHTVEKITFSYEDQDDFTRQYHATKYDCEALFNLGDSIFLMTKDWIHNHTSVYWLPKLPGDYVAKKIYEFDSEGLVTGASYRADTRQLILCGYSDYIPFVTKINLEHITDLPDLRIKRYELITDPGVQIEGVACNGNQIYLSSENSIEKQALYRFVIN